MLSWEIMWWQVKLLLHLGGGRGLLLWLGFFVGELLVVFGWPLVECFLVGLVRQGGKWLVVFSGDCWVLVIGVQYDGWEAVWVEVHEGQQQVNVVFVGGLFAFSP